MPADAPPPDGWCFLTPLSPSALFEFVIEQDAVSRKGTAFFVSGVSSDAGCEVMLIFFRP
jgi:hypothetical protein